MSLLTLVNLVILFSCCRAELNCGKGWSQLQHKCYRYFEVQKTGFEAEIYCRVSAKAEPVSIHSAEENDFVNELCFRKNSHRACWIGGFRAANGSDEFAWSDGSEWSYEKWSTGEPDWPLQQHCVLIGFHGHAKWISHFCNMEESKFPVICQKKFLSHFNN